jgi:hypothetical protein
MRPKPSISSYALLTAVLLASTSALAQTPEAPAAEPAPAPPAEPGPAPAAPAADPLPPPSDPVLPPAAAPAEAPAPEEETWPAAWFRIDSDAAGLQLWAGATHMLSDTVGIATDMYVNSGTLGEFDIGPSFVAGPVSITPMLGLQVNWAQLEAVSLVPQLYVTGAPDPLYFELWVQNYENNVFDDTAGTNTLYFRFFIDYRLGKYFAVGPQVEATLALNDAAKGLFASGETLGSLPVGASIMLSNYGKNNNLFIFAGYETQDTADDTHLAGRLSFVHNF